MKRATRHRLLLALGVAVLAALAVPSATRRVLWHWEQTPVLRGQQLAATLGCGGCHLPYANVEIPNPGSRWGSVPRFGAGNAFMYAPDREGITAFIRDGAPPDWLADETVRQRLADQRIRMPAYGDRLSERQLDDLVAFACAVEGIERVTGDGVAEGRTVARAHGCISCHGLEGAGGVRNPGSFGGFVPGFAGKNFEHLVHDRGEFDAWVRDGVAPRIARHPVASWFLRRQAVAMPAYGDTISDEELDQLWAWVEALRTRARNEG